MAERPISAVIEHWGPGPCQWRPNHDRVLDVPIGPMCGAPATHVIYWLDGSERYSPCCDEHVRDIGPEAPTHTVQALGAYTCPNGHVFPSVKVALCGRCDATVACVPMTQAFALSDEVARLRAGAALARIELDTALSRVGKSDHDVRLLLERARAAIADD